MSEICYIILNYSGEWEIRNFDDSSAITSEKFINFYRLYQYSCSGNQKFYIFEDIRNE